MHLSSNPKGFHPVSPQQANHGFESQWSRKVPTIGGCLAPIFLLVVYLPDPKVEFFFWGSTRMALLDWGDPGDIEGLPPQAVHIKHVQHLTPAMAAILHGTFHRISSPFLASRHLQARHRLLQKHNVLIFPGKYLQPKPSKLNTDFVHWWFGKQDSDVDIIREGIKPLTENMAFSLLYYNRGLLTVLTSIAHHWPFNLASSFAELQIFVNEPQVVAIC